MKYKNLKSALASLLLGAFALTVARAALPTYKTVSAVGNGTATATAYFPEDPNSQVRVIYVNYTSDTNIAGMAFSTGSTAYSVTATNAATSSITNLIGSTNGLAPGATLLLQHAGAIYSATVSSWNSGTATGTTSGGAMTGGTNVVLSSGGWGVITAIGDEVELMTNSVTIPVGATTNVLAGDAIFVGNYGRIVEAQITICNLTDRLYSVSSHYDSASQ